MIDAVSSTTAASGAKAPSKDELKAAAQQFEAIFIRQMISSMRASSLGDDIFGSDASKQFQDMADARVADDMAGKGAFGVAELMLKQFMGRANVTQPAAATATANDAAADSGSKAS